MRFGHDRPSSRVIEEVTGGLQHEEKRDDGGVWACSLKILSGSLRTLVLNCAVEYRHGCEFTLRSTKPSRVMARRHSPLAVLLFTGMCKEQKEEKEEKKEIRDKEKPKEKPKEKLLKEAPKGVQKDRVQKDQKEKVEKDAQKEREKEAWQVVKVSIPVVYLWKPRRKSGRRSNLDCMEISRCRMSGPRKEEIRMKEA